MFDELRHQGFIEGQNLVIDWRAYGQRVDLIPEFVAQVVNAKVDVIYVTGDPKRTLMMEENAPVVGIDRALTQSRYERPWVASTSFD